VTVAYDKAIETTVDQLYTDASVLTSRKMFGGVCYLYRGNMAFGIYEHYLIKRLGDPAQAQEFIDSGKAEVFDITGRPMKNWILVDVETLKTDDDYTYWLEMGLAFAQSLPPK